MLLHAGQRLGPYEILGPLGAGGMGEVYKARDPRLGRTVALKILLETVASDPDRLRRFEREARAVAQLNHPNIVTVHDTGTVDGRAYLVSELIEGETLRSRISRGKLPTSLALDIAKQIARGLQAAHAKGIVHRDLKPENVMLTPDGQVKLLDFGLAKVATHVHGPSDPTVELTEPGIAMGTPSYMSPEQVRGEAIDHRTDIFAFGAIVHEMLSGRRAFPGASAADIMSAVLRADATDISGEVAVPASLQRIIQRCLEKNAGARFQTVADLAFSLEALADTGVTSSGTVRAERSSTRSISGLVAWIGGGLLAAIGVASLVIAHARGPATDNRMLTATILPPPDSLFGTLVVSPDGHWLAFTDESTRGKGQLWIRGLDAPARTRSLPGTAGAANPFWSPDSQSIGFFADNLLKTIAIQGEVPKTIATVTDNRGGSWSRDDVIVFASIAGPMKRVSAIGRETPSPVTALGPNEGTHRWPYFLPDGKHFLYFVRSTDPDLVGTYLASLDDPHGKRLVESTTNAVYAPPGFLLYVGRDRSLLAQPFDLQTLSTTGPAATIEQNPGFTLTINRGSFSTSNTGLLVYGTSEDTQPIWFDRSGSAQGSIGPPGSYSQVVLSSDDERAVVERPDPRTGANDVIVADLSRGGLQTRLTMDPASDSRAIWMPKSDLVVYASNRKGLYDLYMKPASGAGDEAVLFASAESKIPTGGSPDGKILVFESASAKTQKTSLWALTIADKHAWPLLESGFNEAQGRVSPDGKWMAYVTDKDGTFEIYVVDAAGVLSSTADVRHRAAMAGIRVSTAGGTQPLWRRDGKTMALFYVAPDRRLMTVTLGNGPRLSAGAPEALFVSEISNVRQEYQNYAVSADGQRFLILVRPKQAAATVVMNWTSILRPGEK